ncbi:hypothetical protein UA08_07816 [Talaromyces atroroseus]|uniref:Uncharacterized protein n=1 Tax=Talaromyces atroroseus TaxID=1441469 RepID=A0A225AU09_TALAT|nr:hypothetical protein UA08_07816 [Talaromyces atroroseus]OKL56957.1 hypothetical protein UA08_07816 [Talaromyces atroroseus]
MQARAPRQRLHTGAIRSEVLTWHAKHRNWENVTPFISFASSLARLTEFMNSRNWKGDSTLTVVNPNVRIARELPMINMGREMRHYGVPDPYGRGYAYYDAQYLLLWEVTPEEIVGHWDWDELSQNPNWYEEEVVPAFRAHDQRFLEGTSIQDAFDLSAMQGALPGPGAHGDDDDDDDGHKADRGASPSETSHSGDSESASESVSGTGPSSDEQTDEVEASKDEEAKAGDHTQSN